VSGIAEALTYIKADCLNHEDFPAFRRSLEEQALQILLTGNLHDTFYLNRQVVAKEAYEVLEAMCQKDPELYARMILYAREAGCMRILPVVATVILSKAVTGLFAKVFPRVVRTPRELRDFLMICRKSPIRKGLGRALKRSVSEYLLGLSEYHLLKYGRNKGDFSLQDAVRTVHPKARSESERYLLKLILDGKKALEPSILSEHFPQIAAWQDFLEAKHPAERIRLIEQGRLPYEVVVGSVKPGRLLWRALALQMPLMALLRHLKTLIRSRALNCKDTLQYVCSRLTDAENIRRSRILPFRFYSAWKELRRHSEAYERFLSNFIPSHVPWYGQCRVIYSDVLDALEKAILLSLTNLPDLPGKVCIASDVSGSMCGGISLSGTTMLVEIAALFSAALAHKCSSDAIILPFNDRVIPFERVEGESIMEFIERMKLLCGGCTALSAPISLLMEKNISVDHFIGITDNEEWATDSYGNRGFLSVWRHYRRKKANNNARAYLLTLAPYRNAVAPETEPGVHYFYGWSDELVKHLSLCAQESNQLDIVRSWPL